MAPARRARLLRLTLEDDQRLDILATRRGTTPDELAEHIVTTWLDGPGRHELVDALLRPRRGSTQRVRGREAAGQLSLVD